MTCFSDEPVPKTFIKKTLLAGFYILYQNRDQNAIQ